MKRRLHRNTWRQNPPQRPNQEDVLPKTTDETSQWQWWVTNGGSGQRRQVHTFPSSWMNYLKDRKHDGVGLVFTWRDLQGQRPKRAKFKLCTQPWTTILVHYGLRLLRLLCSSLGWLLSSMTVHFCLTSTAFHMTSHFWQSKSHFHSSRNVRVASGANPGAITQ